MATDIKQITDNLLSFYNFTDQVIVTVGAGGGQLIEYARNAKSIIAIDNDVNSLELLQKRLHSTGLNDKYSITHSDFEQTQFKCDIVLFEFSLHEMDNPDFAIRHAKTMANNIVILDHLPDSEWAYLADEETKVSKSWTAIELFNIRDKQSYLTSQNFENYKQLFDKIKIQGENSISRISKYQSISPISIPMSYGLVLL